MKILPGGDPSTWTADTIMLFVVNLIGYGLWIAGAMAVFFLVLGGFEYITAYGSDEKAEKGKKTFTWAIIGLVVILLSSLIVKTLTGLLVVDTITVPPIPDP